MAQPARLQGIYTCTYSDAAAIPEADLGYAAIAQALGMVRGSYQGDRTATRGELAAMLCRLLERREQTWAPERSRPVMEFGRNYT